MMKIHSRTVISAATWMMETRTVFSARSARRNDSGKAATSIEENNSRSVHGTARVSENADLKTTLNAGIFQMDLDHRNHANRH